MPPHVAVDSQRLHGYPVQRGVYPTRKQRSYIRTALTAPPSSSRKHGFETHAAPVLLQALQGDSLQGHLEAM